jgi:stage II sporulation protein D
VVRVALRSDVAEVRVGCTRTWRIGFEGRRLRPNYVTPQEVWTFRHSGGSGIQAIDSAGNDRGVFHETMLLYPDAQGSEMRLEGAEYRGFFVLVARSTGLLLINRVLLEDYLRGVVGNEIGRRAADGRREALKAQAVAARSYTFAQLGGRRDGSFDVFDSELDQVYSGVPGESPDVDAAVFATAGEVLLHGGEFAIAYYSAVCGGRTADAEEVWNGRGRGHLKSRRDRVSGKDLCSESAHFRWRVEWDGETFMEIFRRFYPRFHAWRGGSFGELRDVKIRRRGPSDRVIALEVETTTGRFRVERDAIRWTLRRPESGSPALKSTAFDVDVKRSKGRVTRVVVNGRGYGHGVGLCQAGAVAMSRLGRSYRDILHHYYSGVEIRRVY